ncbi:unnamed protein product [Vitrella brassicaformis CCMP3155]|uniref:Transmembrane protein n=2 Tax=Vitrella brassicaformis TaxID=1169539 RepID=A0A0G4E907_VITBC|nr:unnamed protein product [Vitrella brassicaformis CCMP3155]|eukprot:CEL91686.1 unnamed protein product [Vitrella brassicaformis CCMP3155]
MHTSNVDTAGRPSSSIKMDVGSLKQQKPQSTRRSVLAAVGGVAAYLATMAAVFGLCFAAVQLSKDVVVSEDDMLVSNKDQVPLRFNEDLQFVPVEGLAFLPLAEIQKLESLHILVGEDGERVYNIQAVFRDFKSNTTEAHLSLGHKLVSTPGKFSLIDEKGEVVFQDEYDYELTTPEEAAKVNREEAEELSSSEGGGMRRRLDPRVAGAILGAIFGRRGGFNYGYRPPRRTGGSRSTTYHADGSVTHHHSWEVHHRRLSSRIV